ncbi:unnamed protein product [Cylicocyclus nassatus]|uniref:Uncharacterized protein n=1 Tax=Cylicocyclus nassatus TaxID=53992 RepID=A0AA36DQ50_CYLNA|nr:unnamed protein product [Cylicocyclus nassatus]
MQLLWMRQEKSGEQQGKWHSLIYPAGRPHFREAITYCERHRRCADSSSFLPSLSGGCRRLISMSEVIRCLCDLNSLRSRSSNSIKNCKRPIVAGQLWMKTS